MNQLKYYITLILIVCASACNIQTIENNQANNADIEQVNETENAQVDSSQVRKEDTLDEFLFRAIEIAKSDNECDLKTIINFPLVGYADKYEKKYETFDELKSDGRIYSFFKESLPIAIAIKEDDDLGENWYSVKYKYLQGKNDYYNYYKIDKINGENMIIGVYIPGY